MYTATDIVVEVILEAVSGSLGEASLPARTVSD
jgi:hypothetical protein